jgi:hypothetical protein
MAADVIIDPTNGQIYWNDGTGSPQSISIKGDALNAISFVGYSGSYSPGSSPAGALTLATFNDNSGTDALVPGTTGFNLGSSTLRWNTFASNANLSGTLVVSDSTLSSSLITGSVKFNGGIAISGNASIGQSLNFYNTAATFYTGFKAGSISANTIYTLPTSFPATGTSVLQSDNTGILTWVPLAASSSSGGTVSSGTQYQIAGYYSGTGASVSGSTTFVNNTVLGQVQILHTTSSTGTSTGALHVAGGVGISGRLTFNQASFGTTGISSLPTMAMIGQTGDPIYLSMLEDNSISFEGSQGQLFSISPNLTTGYIWAVNDISGVPLLRASAGGTVNISEYGGVLGIGQTNPIYKLDVKGNIGFASNNDNSYTVLVSNSAASGSNSLQIRSANSILFYNSGNTFYTGLKSNASTNVTFTLPATDGSADQYLKTDGSGVLSWGSPSGGSGSGSSGVNPGGQYQIGYYAATGASIDGSSTFTNNTSTAVVNISHSTAATNYTNGAFTVSGGVGIGGSLYVGGTGSSISGVRLVSGAITAGTWNGTAIATQYGGTGQNLGSSTGILTISSGTVSASTTSSAISSALSDETGSGSLVFNSSPSFGTGVTTGSATFAVFNTNATTINAFGAATTLSIGAATGKATFNSTDNSTSSTAGALVVSGGAGIAKSISIAGRLQLFNSSNYTAFVSSATGNTVYVLPTTSPATGSSVLSSTSDGIMSWVPMTNNSVVTAFGNLGDVQYNDGSDNFTSNANFNYDVDFSQLALSNYPVTTVDSTNAALKLLGISQFWSNGSPYGTFLAINAGTAFTGSLIDARKNDSYRFLVDVNGSIRINYNSGTGWTLPTTNGSSGQVLTANANGIASWTTVSSAGSGTVAIPGAQYQIAAYYSGTGASVSGSSTFTNNTSTNQVAISHNTSSTSTSSGAFTVVGGLGIGGNAFIGGTVSIQDSTTTTSTSTGALVVAGGVGVGGKVYSDSLQTAGNAAIGGNLTVAGTVDLGNATGDTISFLGRVDTDIDPISNNTYDLGVPGLAFRTASFGGSVYFTNTSNTNIFALRAGATGTSLTYILPTDTPTAGQVLAASAPSSGVVTLSWEDDQTGAPAGGITTLNTLTAASQSFATGTSGTDFAISSVTSTHTFNLPDAGSSARGVVSTGTQTFAGAKTFSSALSITDSTVSTSTATGAFKVSGGAGIAGSLYTGTGYSSSISGVVLANNTVNASTYNKVTITAPATSATLTLSNGSSLITSGGHSLTFTTTNSTNVTVPTTGTLATTSNKLSDFAATTSLELLNTITGETGSGALTFATSPTFTTSVVAADATFAVFNTTATTINAFGAATTMSIGAATGKATFNSTDNSTSSTTGALAVSGGAGFAKSVSIAGRLQMFNGANYTAFVSSASGNITYTLPPTAPSGTGTSYLSASTTGEMAWVAAPSGGGGTPGGSNKQVQYNNSSTFGGASGFEYTTGGNGITVSMFSPSGTGYTAGLWVHSINGSTTRVGIGLSNPAYELEILGEISATNKSFVIDHPTKDGMKLRYGSLEGPENGVYIRGELKNSNIIEVPEHWLGLVHPETYTVHLTPIGKYAQLYVEKIENYNVYVADANMNPIHCYYSVWAERKDIPKLITEYEAQ